MTRKPKVGILNFQYSKHNYGAVLQAAALEYTISSLGVDVKHIDFQSKEKFSIRTKIGKLLRTVGLKKSKLPTIFNEEAFEVFRSQFIKRTRVINTEKEFRIVTNNLDVVVVGSDQVWRPRMAKDPLAFFLAYVPEGINRVAYAASFGSSEWEASDDKKLTGRIKHELTQFKGISVRESSGVNICKEIFNVNAVHVLDPLLLVHSTFYKKVLSSSNITEFSEVVYYKLDGDNAFYKDLEVIGRHYNSSPENIYLQKEVINSYQEVADWLSLIYNSKVVVTDSFHCICLAILFDKIVIYCPNIKRGQARMDSLFQMLGITLDSVDLTLSSKMHKLCKPKAMNAVLDKKRKKSLLFLMKSLGVSNV